MKIQINSDEQWRELRSHNIGGSEIAGLFGVSKYHTPFKLYHIKSGNLPEDDLAENERAELGKCLENGIADFLKSKFDLIIRKADSYYVSEICTGMGASLDYEILVDAETGDYIKPQKDMQATEALLRSENHIWVPFEIKHIDFLIFRDEWKHTDEAEPEPAYDIALQVQHQIATVNAPGAYLGLLVGTSAYLIKQPRHDGAIETIYEKVREFWGMVKDKKEPALNKGDLESLKRLYPEVVERPKPLEITENVDHVYDLCKKLEHWAAKTKEAETNKELLQQELLLIMKDNKKAICKNAELVAGERRHKEKFVEAHTKPARIDRLSPVVKFTEAA